MHFRDGPMTHEATPILILLLQLLERSRPVPPGNGRPDREPLWEETMHRQGFAVPLALLLLEPAAAVPTGDHVGRAAATVETAAVPSGGDAADDPAIWIDPQNPSLSLIIGTDKRGGGIGVYDLSGREVQYVPDGRPNNVDVRYGFPLAGARVSLVAFSRRDGTLGVYRVDTARRLLVEAVARPLKVMDKGYGFCLYRSPVSGKFYAFMGDKQGAMEQWELFDDGTGKVGGARVRSLRVGSQSEGCVADDEHAVLYVGEEKGGIWRLGAEPADGTNRERVDTTGPGGHLHADVEGLTIYPAAAGEGYLIASSQGNNRFVVYERRPPNAYVASFEIVADRGIDEVSETDGIDVTGFPLGAAFPEGVFVAQDDSNPGANQNFKLVPWGVIARAVTPRLTVDTTWDPRAGERPPRGAIERPRGEPATAGVRGPAK